MADAEPPGTEGRVSPDRSLAFDARSSAAAEPDLISNAPLVLDDAAFRLLAETVPTLCWIADAAGYIVWYNRRWYAYTGAAPEQMEGWGWTAVHDPEALPSVMARWTASIANGQPFEMTFPLRGADGVFRPFLTRIEPIRGSDGEVARWHGINTDVSEQFAAETALAASQARASRLLDGMAEGFVLLDHDFRVLTINAEGMRLEQRPIAAILGLTHWEAWPGSEQSILGEIYKRAMIDAQPVTFEHLYVWADGHDAWIETRVYPSEGGLAIFYRDVTERKATEAALQASEDRNRTLIESLPQLVWTCLPDGRCDYLSRQWVEYTGMSMQAQLGLDWLDRVIHPDDRERTLAHWMGAVEGLNPYDIEYRIRRQDGVYRWFKTRGTPIRDESGAIGYWFGTCTDIEEIVEAREILSRSSQQLEREVAERTAERDRVWRNSRDLLAVVDETGVFRAANPAWADTLGRTPESVVGSSFHALIHPDDVLPTSDPARPAPSRQDLREHENRYRHADGAYRWISWNTKREGELVYAYGRDVTAARAQAEALAQAEEQLRQAQKMEAVGQLTGGIAHDFNNLLQIVTGNLEIIERNLPEDAARLRRSAGNAMAGARRAASLTQRLLAFSRRQPLAPKAVSLNTLVAGMSELLGRTLGETIDIETVLAGGLWRVEVDPNQLENALLNLAVNARDAMSNGGKLTIETSNAHLDQSYVAEHSEVSPGQYVAVCVSDTGVGMDGETVEKAFEPFFTTKPVGKGTGLGLSQVYGFVKQSGGHLKIYSEPGEGTSVKIYLPRLTGVASEEDRLIEAGTAPEGAQSEVILVVEDDAEVRAFSIEVLRECGYHVLEAADGPSALTLLERREGRVDLLFTDVVLPGGLTGADLAARVQDLRPGLRVLFTTGYARNAIVHHGRLDAGVALITKPFSYTDLAARVREMLDAA